MVYYGVKKTYAILISAGPPGAGTAVGKGVKEVTMATARDRARKEYCDEVLGELAYMIQNIKDLREQGALAYGRDSDVFRSHDRHLGDLEEYIDWKLQILTTACPFEWKGLGESVESVVSVAQPESMTAADASGGYLGG